MYCIASSDPVMLGIVPLQIEKVPHLGCRAFMAVGQQMVAKFKEERVDPVQIYAAVLRLPEVGIR